MTSLVPPRCKSGCECVGETVLEDGWINFLWCCQLKTINEKKGEKKILNVSFVKTYQNLSKDTVTFKANLSVSYTSFHLHSYKLAQYLM